jgi:hypothetical protein
MNSEMVKSRPLALDDLNRMTNRFLGLSEPDDESLEYYKYDLATRMSTLVNHIRSTNLVA